MTPPLLPEAVNRPISSDFQEKRLKSSPPGCVRVRSFLAGSVAKLSTNKFRHHSVRPPLATQQGGIQVYCAGASQFGLAAAQSTTQ